MTRRLLLIVIFVNRNTKIIFFNTVVDKFLNIFNLSKMSLVNTLRRHFIRVRFYARARTCSIITLTFALKRFVIQNCDLESTISQTMDRIGRVIFFMVHHGYIPAARTYQYQHVFSQLSTSDLTVISPNLN